MVLVIEFEVGVVLKHAASVAQETFAKPFGLDQAKIRVEREEQTDKTLDAVKFAGVAIA